MDMTSRPWQRKSSEKSPGETESSGSVSSHSERFSDEQLMKAYYAMQSSQSPEVTSKAMVVDEDMTLSERLSAALLNISAKEELVRQHAKVAEEAISGWEKAESEVSVLKAQLGITTERNASLEDRVSHLDGALKECLRQLRQVREDQVNRINEVITEKTREWESINSDLRLKLDASEEENSALIEELQTRLAELNAKTLELDFSTKAAEMASKQNLESIKKVGKLEAEIRKLKVVSRKAVSASSFYAESFTDTQSDAGERITSSDSGSQNELDRVSTRTEFRMSSSAVIGVGLMRDRSPEKGLMAPSSEARLMNDFLEMERLAGLPVVDSGSPRVRLSAMVNRTAELEDEVEKKSAEKAELEAALEQFHEQLDRSGTCLKIAEARLLELETREAELEEEIKTKEMENAELEMALRQFHEQLNKSETCLKVVEIDGLKKGDAEEKTNSNQSLQKEVATEMESLRDKVKLLEEELGLERAGKLKGEEKCKTLEEEITKMREKLGYAAGYDDELKLKQEQELEAAASKFAKCQKTIASLGQKLMSLANLEDFLVDYDNVPCLIDTEDSQVSEKSDDPKESEPPDLSWQKTEPDCPTGNISIIPSGKAREKGGKNPSQNRNIRHALGKFSTRSKKTGN